MDSIPPEVKAVVPGVAGSLIAMFFLRRPLALMVGMFIGGCALSFFATTAIAEWLEVTKFEGLVGFLTGLFGMALVAKIYDTIEAINANAVWRAILKRLGLEVDP